jgi:hypothetical protein
MMEVTAPPQAALEAEDHDERSVLSGQMVRFVLSHFVGLEASALQDYRFERRETAHSDPDLNIFDNAGRLVFQGREFRSGMAGYWRPARVGLAPESPSEKTWGRQSARRVVAE